MNILARATIQHANCPSKPRMLWAKLRDMRAVSVQRRQLRELDDHLLADIGITRKEATAESGQPPWNVPNHWRN